MQISSTIPYVPAARTPGTELNIGRESFKLAVTIWFEYLCVIPSLSLLFPSNALVAILLDVRIIIEICTRFLL